MQTINIARGKTNYTQFIKQRTTLFGTKKFKSFDHYLVVSCLIMLYKLGRSLIGIKLFHTTNVELCNISFVYWDVG